MPSAGRHFLLTHCWQQSRLSASPTGPAQPPCDHFTLITQVKKCILKSLKDPMSHTLSGFAKAVFRCHTHHLPLGHALTAVGRYTLRNQHTHCHVRRDNCGPSLTFQRATPNHVSPPHNERITLEWKNARICF